MNATDTVDTTATAAPAGVPPALRRRMEARAKAEAERRRKWATNGIRTYTEYLQAEAEKLAKADAVAAEQVEKWGDAQARLKAAGLKFETYLYNLDIVVDVKERRLADVARALGHLDPDTADKTLVDGEKGLVRVTVSPARFPFVKVRYVHKLKAEDRCKVTKVEVPAQTRYELVCGTE